MPFEDFVVADSDMHIFEPPDLWQRYIAEEFRHAAPVGMTELRRDIRVKVKSQVLLRAGPVSPLKERGGRLSEAIPLLRKLWSGEPVTHEGRFYPSFSGVPMQPRAA